MQVDRIHLPLHDSLIFAALFLICNHWLSPDLDLVSLPYYRWGRLKYYWLGYQKLIKHRSVLSHSGPLSFTIRMLYLLAPFLVLWCFFPIPVADYVFYYGFLFWIAGSMADLTHTIADLVT